MGKLLNTVDSVTDTVKASIPSTKFTDSVSEATSAAKDALTLAGRSVVLTLSKAWLGIGLIKPATTQDGPLADYAANNFFNLRRDTYKGEEAETGEINRFDRSELWSVRFDSYFLPLSQTYTARAKKRMNISSLVDGIDIIQQTRKEAKTIDCTLKISLNEDQTNLNIVEQDEEGLNKIIELGTFLDELYETDAVFEVANDQLNKTFGLEYVIMTGYKFIPRPGFKTYTFEFSLMEVKYGDNVLTFDENQLQEE